MQLTHKQFKPELLKAEIVLICDHIQGPANMGAIFRLADAFGVQEIIFSGTKPVLTSGRFKSTARNTEARVRFRESVTIIETLHDLHRNNYKSIALEITSKSIALQTLNTRHNKLVLIVGNERHGVDKELLDIAHFQSHIPMYGKNSSMNVAQATAIALYELSRA